MALMKQPAQQNPNLTNYVGSESASPEEQAQYEQVLDAALTALHDDQTGQIIYQMVIEAKTPQQGIAKAVATLLERLSVDMGGQLADSVKIEVGEDLVDEILDLMIRGGRIQESQVTDEFVEEIIRLAYEEVTTLNEMRGGDMSESAREDITAAQALGFAPELPQGVNAMSTDHAQAATGLMSRGG